MLITRRFTLLVAPRGSAALAARGRCCPRCQSSVFHVARRFADRLVNLFVATQRYRCISLQCNWEGTLRARRSVLLPPGP